MRELRRVGAIGGGWDVSYALLTVQGYSLVNWKE